MSRVPTKIDCSERGQLGARRSEPRRVSRISVFDSLVHRSSIAQQGLRWKPLNEARTKAKCSVRTGSVMALSELNHQTWALQTGGNKEVKTGGSQGCLGRKRLQHFHSDSDLNIYFEYRTLCPPFLRSITDNLSSMSLFFLCLFYNCTIFLGKNLENSFFSTGMPCDYYWSQDILIGTSLLSFKQPIFGLCFCPRDFSAHKAAD